MNNILASSGLNYMRISTRSIHGTNIFAFYQPKIAECRKKKKKKKNSFGGVTLFIKLQVTKNFTLPQVFLPELCHFKFLGWVLYVERNVS